MDPYRDGLSAALLDVRWKAALETRTLTTTRYCLQCAYRWAAHLSPEKEWDFDVDISFACKVTCHLVVGVPAQHWGESWWIMLAL